MAAMKTSFNKKLNSDKLSVTIMSSPWALMLSWHDSYIGKMTLTQ